MGIVIHLPVQILRPCESEADTARLGRALGGVLRAGDVVGMTGPLGAGKTTLVRAVAEGAGIDPAFVSSPTFVMVNEYEAERGPDLVHVDAYRLTGPEDLDALGWDRLTDGACIVLIEWADRIIEALPGATAWIDIDIIGEHGRSIALRLPDAWATRPGFESLRPPTVCPVTGRPVDSGSPTYPFADERAKLADLHRWFSGSYTIGRELTEEDE